MARRMDRAARRQLRHRRIRKKVVGMLERPRLTVFRSHKHMYVQLVDDVAGKTLAGYSTRTRKLKGQGEQGKISTATELGKVIAGDAKKRGIERVVFDRGGYLYHGRIRALAEAVRAGGLRV